MGGCHSLRKQPIQPNEAVALNDRYIMQRVLGKGGFGTVKAAIEKDTNPPRWYAIKILSKSKILDNVEAVNQFFNERRLLALVSNPFIVNMKCCYQDDLHCYVVMDLLPGGDLNYQLNHLRSHNFGMKERYVRFYIACTVVALEYFHSMSILHRDVKPANIMLDADGYARLTDLGVAVETSTLRCHNVSGTRLYQAPEIFSETHDHGIAADFYSLGITAYQLLYGGLPWSHAQLQQHHACPDFSYREFTEKELRQYYPVQLQTEASQGPSSGAKQFLRDLLHPNELHRLGYGGAKEVMAHPWFQKINWESLRSRELKVPYIPDTSRANVDSGYNDLAEFVGVEDYPSHRPLSTEMNKLFAGYDYYPVRLSGRRRSCPAILPSPTVHPVLTEIT